MTFSVKEIYYTLQGEGAHAGRSAVFLRFAGCNLWSGREEDRSTAVCRFCDTDFVGLDGPEGGRYLTETKLAAKVRETWEAGSSSGLAAPFVVCTGGEPMLQITSELIDALHLAGFEIAVETNGTIDVPSSIDWICVSPKAGAELVQRHGDELKLVYPQKNCLPDQFEGLRFSTFSLQPMDGPDQARNTELAMRYCLSNPIWRLSLQLHKVLDIP